MKTTITRTCGHTTEEQLYGPGKDRVRKAAWLKTQPCLQCRREAEALRAETNATAQNLPSLTGGDKQVAWALRIRDQALRQIAGFREEIVATGKAQNVSDDVMTSEMGQFDAVVTKLASETSASWWIDHRSESGSQMLRTRIS